MLNVTTKTGLTDNVRYFTYIMLYDNNKNTSKSEILGIKF